MPDQGMEAGVAGEDLERGARCRIALEHDGDVFTEPIEHAVIFAFPIETLKYSLQTDAVTRDSLPMSPREMQSYEHPVLRGSDRHDVRASRLRADSAARRRAITIRSEQEMRFDAATHRQGTKIACGLRRNNRNRQEGPRNLRVEADVRSIRPGNQSDG